MIERCKTSLLRFNCQMHTVCQFCFIALIFTYGTCIPHDFCHFSTIPFRIKNIPAHRYSAISYGFILIYLPLQHLPSFCHTLPSYCERYSKKSSHKMTFYKPFYESFFVSNYRRTVCPPGITLISPSTRIQMSIAFGLYTRSPSSVNLRFFAAFI